MTAWRAQQMLRIGWEPPSRLSRERVRTLVNQNYGAYPTGITWISPGLFAAVKISPWRRGPPGRNVFGQSFSRYPGSCVTRRFTYARLHGDDDAPPLTTAHGVLHRRRRSRTRCGPT